MSGYEKGPQGPKSEQLPELERTDVSRLRAWGNLIANESNPSRAQDQQDLEEFCKQRGLTLGEGYVRVLVDGTEQEVCMHPEKLGDVLERRPGSGV